LSTTQIASINLSGQNGSPPRIITEELGPVLIVHPSATGFLPSMQTSSN
jgi:hypothetical protein